MQEFIAVDSGAVLPGKKRVGSLSEGNQQNNNQANNSKEGHEGQSKQKKDASGKYKASDFTRGMKLDTRNIQNRQLKASSRYRKHQVHQAAHKAKLNQKWMVEDSQGFIETEGVEKTYNLLQQDIVANAPVGVACNAFDLKLNQLGPYNLSYTNNGQKLILGGSKGHLALIDWKSKKPICEVTEVQDRVLQVCSLHNDLLFAAAQSTCVYIYNHLGQEVHRMNDHSHPFKIEFLKHHFLLCSISKHGFLTWQDISQGETVKRMKTSVYPSEFCQNPASGVLCIGDVKGTVSMWTPNMDGYAMKMLVHRGAVKGLAIDPSGKYMITAGIDGWMNVWDIRYSKQQLFDYRTGGTISSLSVSQAGGMVAISRANEIKIFSDIWKQQQQYPYLTHRLPTSMGTANDLKFCPYEDALGVGCELGVSSLLVPGCGIGAYDAFVADPFETKKQRQEREVRALLDKPPPESIILFPDTFGEIIREPEEIVEEREAEEIAANELARQQQLQKTLSRNKMRGRSKISKKVAKKQQFKYREFVTKIKTALRKRKEQKQLYQEQIQQQQQQEESKSYKQKKLKDVNLEDIPVALQTFYK